jgi:hypothetical protein
MTNAADFSAIVAIAKTGQKVTWATPYAISAGRRAPMGAAMVPVKKSTARLTSSSIRWVFAITTIQPWPATGKSPGSFLKASGGMISPGACTGKSAPRNVSPRRLPAVRRESASRAS